jgi:hypothetical protein
VAADHHRQLGGLVLVIGRIAVSEPMQGDQCINDFLVDLVRF